MGAVRTQQKPAAAPLGPREGIGGQLVCDGHNDEGQSFVSPISPSRSLCVVLKVLRGNLGMIDDRAVGDAGRLAVVVPLVSAMYPRRDRIGR